MTEGGRLLNVNIETQCAEPGELDRHPNLKFDRL